MGMEISLTHENGQDSARCDSFVRANAVLRRWATTNQCVVGGDKIDFTLTHGAKGLFYSGRYDLKPLRVDTPDLVRHITSQLDWVSGMARPAHCSEEQYQADLSNFSPAARNRAFFYRQVVQDIADAEMHPGDDVRDTAVDAPAPTC